MSSSVTSDSQVDGRDSNITAFDSWDAALAYANTLSGGPVTVRVAGEPTIYRVTSDGRKRALCHA
jgi:hypothetical protein